MKTKVFAFVLLAAGAAFGQISIGVRIGAPPRPRVVRVQPRSPGAGYMFVDGYWYAEGGRYRWHDGYWTRPPYEGARWVGPRHDGQQFYAGYWDGNNGRLDHSHKWDKDRNHNRDYNRKQ